MNILEKFISIFKNCIIIISGYEKLHLSKYADQLATDFNFELIEFKYPDFESLNKKIKDLHENNNKNGVIIYGLTFPTDNLEFKANYHISLSANKTLVDDENEFNIYNNNVKQNFINKFKNVKVTDYNDELYDDIFNTVIEYIMKKVYGENFEKAQQKYIEDTESKATDKQIESVKDEEDDTNDLSESSVSSGGSYKRNIVKGTRRILKKAPKKTTKKTSKKESRKGSMKGGNERKKTSKPKKLKRVIGTRLLMNVIKV